MTRRGPISVVSFTHLGYEKDQISEVTYRSVTKLAESDLLRTLYVLDVEPSVELDQELISTPIPGGKTIPRFMYVVGDLAPGNLLNARKFISTLFDRLVAGELEGGQLVHLFPEFQHTAEFASRNGFTTVVYARGCHPEETLRLYEEEKDRFSEDIWIPYDWFNRYRRTYNYADYVFYLCDYVKQTFLERGFSSDRLIKVGPLSVDTKRYRPGDLNTDKFVVLAVSNMTPLKGTRYLLDAWEKLELDNSLLVLCGEMSDGVSAELSSRIEKSQSIEHLGQVDDVASQYRRASVFVHPSLTEGFGKVYAEAMATGLPVIATENGPVEFIDDSGFIIPIRDAEAIAEKIRYLHDHPEIARRMGRCGREIIVANSWDGFSERVKDGHLQVLEGLE